MKVLQWKFSNIERLEDGKFLDKTIINGLSSGMSTTWEHHLALVGAEVTLHEDGRSPALKVRRCDCVGYLWEIQGYGKRPIGMAFNTDRCALEAPMPSGRWEVEAQCHWNIALCERKPSRKCKNKWTHSMLPPTIQDILAWITKLKCYFNSQLNFLFYLCILMNLVSVLHIKSSIL